MSGETAQFKRDMAKQAELECRFRKVVAKALSLGLGGTQIAKLESVRAVSRKRQERCRWRWKQAWVLCSVLVVLVALVLYLELYTVQGFTLLWLRWQDRDYRSERCTIDMPTALQDLFRPPVDCSMCRHIQSVERVSAIDPNIFKQRYAYSGIPVIVTDATANWTAGQKFSFAFFKNLYQEGSPALDNFRYDCQFFPYQTEFYSLGNVFEMSEERAALKDGSRPWYIGWSNCDSSAADILREHYRRPYFLPLDAESSRTDWIFMGSPGYGAHMHIDHVDNPSWQAQITGRKHWILKPPPECYYACSTLEVTVEPGEIIVLDTNKWYHKTQILGTDLSITIGSEYD